MPAWPLRLPVQGGAGLAVRRYPSGRATAAQLWSAASLDDGGLPAIYIGEDDRRDIAHLLAALPSPDPFVADFLERELGRAILYRSGDLPRDAVTMNAQLVYRRSADHAPEFGTLVYPDRYPTAHGAVSILSPLGVALLGLREGGRMAFADRDGTPRTVRVEAVVHQPGRQPPAGMA